MICNSQQVESLLSLCAWDRNSDTLPPLHNCQELSQGSLWIATGSTLNHCWACAPATGALTPSHHCRSAGIRLRAVSGLQQSAFEIIAELVCLRQELLYLATATCRPEFVSGQSLDCASQHLKSLLSFCACDRNSYTLPLLRQISVGRQERGDSIYHG